MDYQRDIQQFFKSSAPHRLSYRPDIDGLRAVAGCLVVLFHAWPNWLRSGFIGVDVFFVISGFLITSIILDDLERGSFSIREFYVRRIRRIFPALIAVVAATLLFGWYVLLHHEFTQLGKHITAAATFLSNLVLWNESGYFDNDHTTKPLLHLWSLGVEEQFYLVWPVMLAICSRKRGGIVAFLSITLGASFVYGLYATYNAPAEAYYSPVTRFWELACGGMVAYVLSGREQPVPARALLSAGGIVLLVLGCVYIDGQTAFPGAWALLPVAGTSALIMAGNEGWINRHLLGNPLMARIGLVSYPFYLWHWPLLSFGYIIEGEKPSAQAKAVLVLASFVLAVLTWRLVERPIQKSPKRMRAIQALVTAMLCFGVAGALANSGLLRERIPGNGTDKYLRALNDLGFPQPAMKSLRYHGSLFHELAGHGTGTTVLVGDSVMEQYAPLVAEGLRTSRFDRKSVIFATAGGCPPIRGAVRLPKIRFPTCTQTVIDAYDLAASPEVDTVVIAAAWYGYFTPYQDEVEMPVGDKLEQFPSAPAHEAAYASMLQAIRMLRAKGKRVYLVLQPPTGDKFDPRSMITGSRFNEMMPRTDMPPFLVNEFREVNAEPIARLKEIARQTGTIVVDPVDYLCKDGKCPVLSQSGEPIYTDPVHMRPYFVRTVRYLDDALSSQIRKAQAR